MFKQATAALALVGMIGSLSACASGPGGMPDPMAGAPKDSPDTVGRGSFLVSVFPGLPAHDGEAAVPADPYGQGQFRELQYLSRKCHEQLDPYIPLAAKEIGSFSLKMGVAEGLGSAAGTGLGAIAGFTGVSFLNYFKYGGFAGLGAGLGAGAVSAANQYRVAVSYVEYACEYGFVGRAQQFGHLKGVNIIPWAGSGWAKPAEMPAGNQPDRSTDLEGDQASTSAMTPAPPPP